MTGDLRRDDADGTDSQRQAPVAAATAKGWSGTLVQALAIGVGAAVGQYVGVHLLIPATATAIVWWLGRKLLPTDKGIVVPALAINAGQLIWLTAALALRGGLNADVVDPVVHAIGLAWLVARPGVAPIYLLAAYQAVALAFNVLAFVEAAAGTESHKALLVAMLWRGMALVAMGRLWLSLRQQKHKTQASEATTA